MTTSFDHRAHLQLAWEAIARGGLPAALVEIPAYLRGMARAAGQPDRYHETVTVGFLLLIADRCAEPPASEPFDGFVERNLDLLDPGVLQRFWRPATLRSDRARRRFVFPDEHRQSLPDRVGPPLPAPGPVEPC
jgi:hypothetical protein